MKRHINIERKSFEIWSDDLEGPGVFSITERAKGCPHTFSFDSSLCEKVISFLQKEKTARSDVRFRETLRYNGVSIFLMRGSNGQGWFIKMMEWQKDHKNVFIVVPTDIDRAGWSSLALVLQQMRKAKSKVVVPPTDYVPEVKFLGRKKGECSIEVNGRSKGVTDEEMGSDHVLLCGVWGALDWTKIKARLCSEGGFSERDVVLFPVGVPMNRALWCLKPNMAVNPLVRKGLLDFEEGVILLRKWSPMAQFVSPVLVGEHWITVLGLPPLMRTMECLSLVAANCGGLKVDNKNFSALPLTNPRIKLLSGDLCRIPHVMAIRLKGVDCILASEVQILPAAGCPGYDEGLKGDDARCSVENTL